MRYKEFINESSDIFDLFDEGIESDNEKFLAFTNGDADDEVSVTIEKYANEDDNDTEVVATVYYDIEDDSVLRDSGIEVYGWGKKNESKIRSIVHKEFNGSNYSNEREVAKDLDAVVKNLTKLW